MQRVNLSPFSHSLSISSSFSHSLSIFSEPGCQDATIFATLVYAKRLFSKIKTTFIYSRGCAAYKCIGTIKLLHFPLSVFSSSNKKERCCSLCHLFYLKSGKYQISLFPGLLDVFIQLVVMDFFYKLEKLPNFL